MAVRPEIVGPTWVEVDLDAVAHNTQAVKRYVGTGCRLLSVVANDASGHGAVEVARVVTASGADYLGVNTLPEALELRSGGIMAPILVFTPVEPQETAAALEARLTLTVVDTGGAAVLAKAAGEARLRARVHVRVDSGAGGYGLPAEEALRLISYIHDQVELDLEGLYTHLSTDGGAARLRERLQRFKTLLAEMDERGMRVRLAHAAGDPVLLAEPASHLKMVRVGDLLYGRVGRGYVGRLDLHETLRIRARVGQVRRLEAGEACCQGLTAKIPLTVAILAVDDARRYLPAGKGSVERLGDRLRNPVEALLQRTGLPWQPRRRRDVQVELHDRPVRVLGAGTGGELAIDASGLEGVVAGDEAVLRLPGPPDPRLARVYYRHDRPYKARTLLGEYYFHGGEESWQLERTAEGEVAAGVSD